MFFFFLLEPVIERNTTMEHDNTQITFQAPIKPIRERVYTKLPKSVANSRGKYFRTNFSHQLQYASIDSKQKSIELNLRHFFVFFLSIAFNETRVLLQTPMNFDLQSNDELEQFLELYFSSCIQQNQNSNNIPHFQVRQDPNVVQQILEFYTKIIDESKHNEQSKKLF